MKLKVILALVLVLLLVGTAVVEAKAGKSGGKIGGSSKSFSTQPKGSSLKEGAPIAAAVAVPALAKKTKKPHLDDDLLENETEEAEQSPGFEALPALMGIALWFLSKSSRKAGP